MEQMLVVTERVRDSRLSQLQSANRGLRSENRGLVRVVASLSS